MPETEYFQYSQKLPEIDQRALCVYKYPQGNSILQILYSLARTRQTNISSMDTMFNKDTSHDSYNRLGKLQCEIQHGATLSLRSLFLARWLEVKRVSFVQYTADSGNIPSDASINELENELRHIVPDLRCPVEDWDMTVVCTALTAKSFKPVMYNSVLPTTKKRFLRSVMRQLPLW